MLYSIEILFSYIRHLHGLAVLINAARLKTGLKRIELTMTCLSCFNATTYEDNLICFIVANRLPTSLRILCRGQGIECKQQHPDDGKNFVAKDQRTVLPFCRCEFPKTPHAQVFFQSSRIHPEFHSS